MAMAFGVANIWIWVSLLVKVRSYLELTEGTLTSPAPAPQTPTAMGNNSIEKARPRSRNENTAHVPGHNLSPSDTTDTRLLLNGLKPHRSRKDGSLLGFAERV